MGGTSDWRRRAHAARLILIRQYGPSYGVAVLIMENIFHDGRYRGAV
jgi:hypothetical protein